MDNELKTGWLLAGKLATLWKSTVSGSVISSVLGFSWTESQTGDVRTAFMVAAVSGAIGAICATIPRLVLALKEARESSSRIHQAEMNNIIARMHESHAEDRASLKQTVEWAQNQAALTRISKHAALSEVFRLRMRNVVIENCLSNNSIVAPPENKPLRDLDEILAEEDRQMRLMLDKRIDPSTGNR